MNAADTSVVIAAFAILARDHEIARRALDGGLRLIEHCALETYCVLTRFPALHRSPDLIVREFLEARFQRHRRALPICERYGVRVELLL